MKPNSLFQTSSMATGHHGDSWTNKPAMRDDRVSPLSDSEIMLIRPQQALPLARNNSKLLIFNNVFKISGIQASLGDLYQEKEDNLFIFFLFHIFSRPSYSTCCRGQSWPYYIGSKRGKLQACPHSQCCTLFPEGGVVWKIPYQPNANPNQPIDTPNTSKWNIVCVGQFRVGITLGM